MDNDFMVDSGFEVNDGVIISKLNIKDEDTIIITIDIDKWDINEAYEIFKMVAKVFPNNNIVTTFKGIDIKVEKTGMGTTSSENS